MEFLRQLVNQVRDLLQKMSLGQRVSIAALGITLVASLLWLVIWASTTQWEPLFAKVDPSLMEEIHQELTSSGVEHKIESGRILVKVGTRDEIIMQLAPKNLLPTAEDKHGDWLFTSDLAESSSRFDAKQFETLKRRLASMIAALDEVESARVEFMAPLDPRHILYQEERDSSTATVVVALARGRRGLSDGTVMAIANIVSHSLVNVPPHNVSISDQYRSYLVPEDDSAAGGANTLERQRLAREKDIKAKIQRLLMYIPSHVVEVHEELVRENVASKEYVPDPDRVIHKVSRELKREGRTEEVAGEPGVVPNASAEIPGGSGTNTAEKEEEKEYFKPIVGEKTTETTTAAGGRKRLTVSVIIPLSEAPGVPIKDGQPDRESAAAKSALDGTNSELKKLRNNVALAVGGALEGSTAVDEYAAVVNVIDFAVAPPEKPDMWAHVAAWFEENGARMFLGLVTILALLMVYQIVKKAVPTPQPLFVAEEEEVEAEKEEEVEPQLDVSQLSVDERKALFIREKVQQIVRENPTGSAKLIKGWLWNR